MPQLLNRKPNRLKNYDYSSGGYYSVTICSKDRENIFSEIDNCRINVGTGLGGCLINIFICSKIFDYFDIFLNSI